MALNRKDNDGVILNDKSDFSKIEKKWQKRWEKEKVFKVKEGKEKYYVLEMYPYPSGSGLHMGHAFNYVIGDIYARFMRMMGKNVLYPMGYDSFGLPAENAAIKAGVHPKEYTENAMKKYILQQKELGLSYDWDRMIYSHDPDYYKWNQYFFIEFLKKGLVYRKKASVNYCNKCDSVLANEQVHQGKCWRHEDTDVEIRKLEQWFIRTTDYADELLNGIKGLDWPERIKVMQENWIGKSTGAEVMFRVNGENWSVFTTRPDTLFGATFLVISAQHDRLMDVVSSDKMEEVQKFLKKVRSVRQGDLNKLEKEGVFAGTTAIHPLTGESIPIWIGNFVVADYGSGMVMGVPAHDQRDYEFAKKYKIPIKIVISKDGKDSGRLERAYEGTGIMINSRGFDGVDNEEAKKLIINVLKKERNGAESIKYKLRDWLISRQRYWGTPIPVVYCEDCGIVSVPENELPVLLPEKVRFGKGNPLESNKDFVSAKCYKCGKNARRETDTMDTFVDSSWYYLRYTDNKNKKKPFDKKKADYWMPVDQYIGGAEHACMHLIYARFFTKVLRDLGHVKISEPFKKLFNQGMLHKNGFVMSKSRGNVILPEDVSKRYGIDTARLFLVSIANPDKDIEWSDEGIEGSFRFVNKVLKYFENYEEGKSNEKVAHKINKGIKGIEEDVKEFRYNLAVIKLREMFDGIEQEKVGRKEAEIFIKAICIFCPHIAEELWEKMGNKGFVSLEKWPKYDESKINERFEESEKNVDKTVFDVLNVINIIKEKGGSAEKIYIYVIPKEFENYDSDVLSKRIGKEVVVYRVNDKSKFDPEGKSSRAKPGKPGIYIK